MLMQWPAQHYNLGSWGQPGIDASDSTMLTCEPSPCPAANPTAADSSVVLPSNAVWACTGQTNDGTQPKLVCDPNSCTSTPTSANMPALSSWSCSSLSDGSKCSATCSSGYTAQAGTSWVATCSLGSWGQPSFDTGGTAKLECLSNSCTGQPSTPKTKLVCNPNSCTGQPSTTTGVQPQLLP
ncbi:hypothetical protein OEZ85_007386 [Tetradesmus obliquus]|uniref:Sushi domain-containing protein n=1 Tax=Tetradesmus obliquus TaxID=3088 RepID=A0ABY8THG5_TETOB|nr:hypothetical protein OEZ85_007386 [Tetradesmus obliquus]